MNVKERLISYLEYKGLSKSEFGRRIGVSNAFVTSIRKSIQPDKVATIQKEFPDLNISWLLTGNGEMIKGDTGEEENLEVPAVNNHGKRNDRMIPFYDAETTGGYSDYVAASDGVARLQGYIHAGDWFDGRETAAIRHTGDSMKEYPNGCILAVREVRDIRLLIPGRNYVIETDEYRITKRVQKGSEKGLIALYSTNQEKYDDGRLIYEPFEVALEDVRRIFSVLGYIVSQSGESQLIRT